jgi:hypothetical protein
MFIALVKNIFNSVRSGMCRRRYISLLTELETVDDGQTINISLLTELSISVFLSRTHVSLSVTHTLSLSSVFDCYSS